MLVNLHKKGLLYIVSAPAGTGKTTLIERLKSEFKSVVPSISYTTRTPRAGEVDGVHYHFVSESQFKQMLDQKEFLETVELYGSYYGTSKLDVQSSLEKGNHVFLVIDTQGAEKIKNGPLKVSTTIFIKPPSLEALKKRLENRKTESKELLEKRLKWAEIEMESEKNYEFSLINDNLDEAYDVLRSIFIAVDHRRTSGTD